MGQHTLHLSLTLSQHTLSFVKAGGVVQDMAGSSCQEIIMPHVQTSCRCTACACGRYGLSCHTVACAASEPQLLSHKATW